MSLSKDKFTSVKPSNFSFNRHPFSAVFGDIKGADQQEFNQRIDEHGLSRAIVLWPDEQTILDGWQRYLACGAMKKKMFFVLLQEQDEHAVKEWLYDENASRRGTSGQKRALWRLRLGLGSVVNPSESDEVSSVTAETTASVGEQIEQLAAKASTTPDAARKAVREHRKETGQTKPKEPKPAKDALGKVIPREMLVDWNYAVSAAQHVLRTLAKIQHFAKEEFDKRTRALRGLMGHELINQVSAWRGEFRQEHYPHVICLDCQGHNRHNCQTCHGRGFLTEWYWKTLVAQRDRILEGDPQANGAPPPDEEIKY
jgi:hypothetical protein